ncbi:ATP-binding protein [Streptomyces sp. NPDC002054]|uniref:wHTH domain-containing protein n=1 Tax=Streptomyces sp. NPDC002054 TaxID=3154663 RepID=UPI00332E2056
MDRGPVGDTVGNTFGGDASAQVVIQAQTVNGVHFGPQPSAAPQQDEGTAGSRDPWVRRAADSPVWRHVPAGRDTGAHRQRATAVAAELARLRDLLEPALADDPWNDPGIPIRFLDRIELLLGEPAGCPDPLDLYPAEAALLVLLPFLHRIHYLRLAARLREEVRPWRLRPEEGAGPGRRAYEIFVDEDESLVQRALRNPEEEAAKVGWWLFHRWLIQQREFADPVPVGELLGELAESTALLGGTLTTRRVTTLLQGLWRGPDVCHAEFLDQLAADDGVRTGSGHEQVREQRLMLIAALGYGMAIEMQTLPGIVAEHLATPHAVDLDELRTTLDGARWGGPPDLRVLKAECRHEAVVEGIRAHVARADELLDAVRRTGRERITHPLPPLPARLSADGVVPTGRAFDGYARFRSDGRRFRDLAMGIELYKDRDLAVRELYQNALDACRYRQARSRYLDLTQPALGGVPYTGLISFVQGTDEAGAYLECTDNGVGMGESELRGVFAQAGARFAEQLEFKLERTAWETVSPPVTLHPNSRFGIGVLSYFMLADEIEVTTCRMAPDGGLGPVYQVSICGPGHLFRIRKIAPRGREPGTKIRLRLRPDVVPEEWSSVQALERILAIAEFETIAVEHGGEPSRWPAKELRARKDVRVGVGYTADGWLRPWPDAPDGVQVVWCERGGALLVDGLVVEPKQRVGVFSSNRSRGGLRGAVVNLSGPWSPAKLSVDRRHVLDSVAPTVAGLLEQAACVLDQERPSFEWLCDVADESMPLGDLVAGSGLPAGREVVYRGMRFGTGRAGFFPADVSLFSRELSGFDWYEDHLAMARVTRIPDHVYLWRVLARRPELALRELGEVCPELAEFGPVRVAVLSDQEFLIGPARPDDLHDVAQLADDFRTDPRDLARRLSALGFHEIGPEDWAPDARLTRENAGVFLSLGRGLAKGGPVTAGRLMEAAGRREIRATAEQLRSFGFQVPEDSVRLCEAARKEPVLLLDPARPWMGCLSAGATVPLGHLAMVSRACDLPVPEVRRRLASHGLAVDERALPDRPSKEVTLFLSRDADGEWPWLERDVQPPPGHILTLAERLGLEPAQVLVRLAALGVAVPEPFPADASVRDLEILGRSPSTLRREEPLRYGEILNEATSLQDVRHRVARLRAYGFSVPLQVPARPTLRDEEVLGRDSPFRWTAQAVDALVPFAHVLTAAQRLQVTPAALARRLRSYGLTVVPMALPQGLPVSVALRLIGSDELATEEKPTAEDFSLHYLHRVARRTRRTITEVASLIRQLGIPVPDPADTIRAALARVPRG